MCCLRCCYFIYASFHQFQLSIWLTKSPLNGFELKMSNLGRNLSDFFSFLWDAMKDNHTNEPVFFFEQLFVLNRFKDPSFRGRSLNPIATPGKPRRCEQFDERCPALLRTKDAGDAISSSRHGSQAGRSVSLCVRCDPSVRAWVPLDGTLQGKPRLWRSSSTYTDRSRKRDFFCDDFLQSAPGLDQRKLTLISSSDKRNALSQRNGTLVRNKESCTGQVSAP